MSTAAPDGISSPEEEKELRTRRRNLAISIGAGAAAVILVCVILATKKKTMHRERKELRSRSTKTRGTPLTTGSAVSMESKSRSVTDRGPPTPISSRDPSRKQVVFWKSGWMKDRYGAHGNATNTRGKLETTFNMISSVGTRHVEAEGRKYMSGVVKAAGFALAGPIGLFVLDHPIGLALGALMDELFPPGPATPTQLDRMESTLNDIKKTLDSVASGIEAIQSVMKTEFEKVITQTKYSTSYGFVIGDRSRINLTYNKWNSYIDYERKGYVPPLDPKTIAAWRNEALNDRWTDLTDITDRLDRKSPEGLLGLWDQLVSLSTYKPEYFIPKAAVDARWGHYLVLEGTQIRAVHLYVEASHTPDLNGKLEPSAATQIQVDPYMDIIEEQRALWMPMLPPFLEYPYLWQRTAKLQWADHGEMQYTDVEGGVLMSHPPRWPGWRFPTIQEVLTLASELNDGGLSKPWTNHNMNSDVGFPLSELTFKSSTFEGGDLRSDHFMRLLIMIGLIRDEKKPHTTRFITLGSYKANTYNGLLKASKDGQGLGIFNVTENNWEPVDTIADKNWRTVVVHALLVKSIDLDEERPKYVPPRRVFCRGVEGYWSSPGTGTYTTIVAAVPDIKNTTSLCDLNFTVDDGIFGWKNLWGRVTSPKMLGWIEAGKRFRMHWIQPETADMSSVEWIGTYDEDAGTITWAAAGVDSRLVWCRKEAKCLKDVIAPKMIDFIPPVPRPLCNELSQSRWEQWTGVPYDAHSNHSATITIVLPKSKKTPKAECDLLFFFRPRSQPDLPPTGIEGYAENVETLNPDNGKVIFKDFLWRPDGSSASGKWLKGQLSDDKMRIGWYRGITPLSIWYRVESDLPSEEFRKIPVPPPPSKEEEKEGKEAALDMEPPCKPLHRSIWQRFDTGVLPLQEFQLFALESKYREAPGHNICEFFFSVIYRPDETGKQPALTPYKAWIGSDDIKTIKIKEKGATSSQPYRFLATLEHGGQVMKWAYVSSTSARGDIMDPKYDRIWKRGTALLLPAR